MQQDYWIKDQTRKETITKTLIPNLRNFELFATYYNLIDKKGLSFPLSFDNELIVNKIYQKNLYNYFVLEHNGLKELYILPNENITELTEKIVSKIDDCCCENEVVDLLITEM